MNEPPVFMSDVDEHYRSCIDLALTAFTRSTGLPAQLVADQPPPLGNAEPVDAAVAIESGGRRYQFMAEVKFNVDRRVTLGDALRRVTPYGDEGLLITSYVTHTLAKACREKIGLQFIDAAGNAFLKRDGLFVYINGERPVSEEPAGPPQTSATTAWLKVVFALLCRPVLRSASYRDLAKAARVALGTVGPVIIALETRRYVVPNTNRGSRVLLEPARLFQEWLTNYASRLRPKLHRQLFRAERPDWWRDADIRSAGAYWGGEVAAEKLTGYLKPTTCTIYVPPEQRRRVLQELVVKHRLQADPRGDIELLDAFWNFPAADQEHDAVPPILVYADLRDSLDPRNLEVAELVRERYLKDAFGANAFGTV